MSTLSQNHFEGQTVGASVTTGNSSTYGDTALGVVSATGTGAALTYDSSNAAHGSRSIKFAGAGSTGTVVTLIGYTGYSATQAVTRTYFYFTGVPSTTNSIIQLRSSSGTLAALNLLPSSRLQLNVVQGNQNFGGASGDFTISLNTLYRIEVAFGLDASAGSIAFDVYAGDSTSSLYHIAASSLNTGSNAIYGVRIGKLTSGPTMADFWADDLSMNDATLTYLGAYSPPSNNPPAVSASNSGPVSVNTSVTLTGTATDSDGTITSMLWTCTSRPAGAALPSASGATTLTTSFTPTVAGSYVFSFAATDNSSATTTVNTTVTVTTPPPTANGTLINGIARIDARSLSSGGTALTYDISPTSGVEEPVDGYFVVTNPGTYTVTATDTYNQTGTKTFVVPAVSSSGALVEDVIQSGGVWPL